LCAFASNQPVFKSQSLRGLVSCSTLPGLEASFFQDLTVTWSCKVEGFHCFSVFLVISEPSELVQCCFLLICLFWSLRWSCCSTWQLFFFWFYSLWLPFTVSLVSRLFQSFGCPCWCALVPLASSKTVYTSSNLMPHAYLFWWSLHCANYQLLLQSAAT
jgi:hypothetical protein